jgi:hypothetical protein
MLIKATEACCMHARLIKMLSFLSFISSIASFAQARWYFRKELEAA